MASYEPSWLPSLVLLESYGGNWKEYVEGLYRFYVEDFVKSCPTFNGSRIARKRIPVEEGKEGAFWHIISEGDVEAARVPDLRRCERIRWPRPIIDHSSEEVVSVWENTSRGERRICLWLKRRDYLVVLAPRSGYILFWTAYPVTSDRRKAKLEAERSSWEKASAAPGKGDGTVTPSTHGR